MQAVVICLIGLLMAFHPTIFSLFSQMQTDPGDTRFINYVLEHYYGFFAGHGASGSFWNMPFFHPAPNVSTYSDLELGVLPFYALWRALGFGPENSFQLWTITILVLNFAVFHKFLLKWFVKNATSAAFGAFIFTFASSRINKTGHPHMFEMFYPVIAIHAIAMLFSGAMREKNPGFNKKFIFIWSLVFFAAVSIQAWTVVYYDWFLGFCLVVAFLAGLFIKNIRKAYVNLLTRGWIPVAAALGLFCLSLYPLAAKFLEVSKEVGPRPWWHVVDYFLPLQAWFHVGPWNVPYAWLMKIKLFRMIAQEGEMRMGVGLITPVLVILGLRKLVKSPDRRTAGLVLVAVLVIGMVFFSQYKRHTFFKLLFDWVPAANSLRVYSRIALMFLIIYGIAAAYFIEILQTRKKILACVLVGLCMSEQLVHTSSFDWKEYKAEVKVLATKISNDCDSFVYTPKASKNTFPFSWKYQLDAMWAGLLTGKPTMNGHSSNAPNGWRFLDILLDGSKADGTIEANLASWTAQNRDKLKNHCRITAHADEIKKEALLSAQESTGQKPKPL